MSFEFIEMSMMARFLFAPSTLPLTQLLMRSNLQALVNLFAFQSQQIDADTNQFRLIAGMGEFEKIPIQQLVIDPISISLSIVGERADMDKVFECIRQFLSQIDPKRRMDNPSLYTMTYQTQSTARLSFACERLLSDNLVNFISSTKDSFKPSGCASVDMSLSNLSFQVKFSSLSDTFFFMPKVLTIEPRAGSDPKEKLYYIVTPTDSDEHRRLVEDFDKKMSGAL